MHDIKRQIGDLHERFVKFKESLDLSSKRKRIEILESESSVENFWDNQNKARVLMQELGDLKNEIGEIDTITSELDALFELSKEGELEESLEADIRSITKKIKSLEVDTFLSGKYDNKNAIFSIHAGQGGTEAMDWASMLLRMYMRFCEKKGWKFSIINETAGEEAGIKSVEFKVDGKNTYGYLKREAGAHRLVRQSPFNADSLRQTSFALVEVLPELAGTDLPDIEIRDEDLDIQFYRSSGSGGQNVNKVSTAVRLIHKPSKITVTAQTQRSQHQNREFAMNLLRGRLWAKKLEEEAKEKENIQGEYTPASWGAQIRSYVLHPYKMVKDLRTHVETSDAEGVLDGNLDEFVEAELRLS